MTMAILLTSLHTAPLPREFMAFAPERSNFFGSAPDRQWLGFTQYVSEKPLATMVRNPSGGKNSYMPRIFDGHYQKVGDPNKPYSIRDLSGQETAQTSHLADISNPGWSASMRRNRVGGANQAAVPQAAGSGHAGTYTAPASPGGNQSPANPGF